MPRKNGRVIYLDKPRADPNQGAIIRRGIGPRRIRQRVRRLVPATGPGMAGQESGPGMAGQESDPFFDLVNLHKIVYVPWLGVKTKRVLKYLVLVIVLVVGFIFGRGHYAKMMRELAASF